MGRLTTMEIAHQHPSGAVGVVDVERLGTWVHFSATIDELDRGHGPQPVVVQLRAQNDDGEDVPIGQAEHASVSVMFLQAYYRWRRNACRSPAPTAP